MQPNPGFLGQRVQVAGRLVECVHRVCPPSQILRQASRSQTTCVNFKASVSAWQMANSYSIKATRFKHAVASSIPRLLNPLPAVGEGARLEHVILFLAQGSEP